MPEEVAPEVEPVDQFVADIVKSFNKVLPPSEEPPTEIAELSGMTVAEAMLAHKPSEKKPEADPAAPASPAAAPQKTPPKVVVKRAITPVVEPPPVVEPAKKETTAEELAAQQAVTDQKEYEKTLLEEEREILELARFAEGKGRKGLVNQYFDFFKKRDKFIEENPSLEEDSEELANFIRDNRPKLSDSERRKFEREMIIEEATSIAERKAKESIEPEKRELKNLRVKPLVDETVASVESLITTKSEQNPDAVPFDPDVVKVLREKGYAEAVKQFPMEAPIVSGTINATAAWVRMANGVDTFDEKNPVHQWIVDFLSQEARNLKSMPKEVQVVNGRQFLPMHEYLALQRSSPDKVDGFWTFSDEMVVDMIAANGIISHTKQIRDLESSGWKREVKPAAEKPQNTPVATPPVVVPSEATPQGSPRGGGRSIPGAANDPVPKEDHKDFIDKLIPPRVPLTV